MSIVTKKNIYNPPATFRMSPPFFMVFLFIISITMIFAALTSAYIFRRSEGSWLSIEIPNLFWVSGGIISLSSFFLEFAKKTFKKNNLNAVFIPIFIVFLLGVGFIFTQWQGWQKLIENNVYFVSTPSATFIYVLTGLHIFHLFTALVYLIMIVKKMLDFRQNIQIEKNIVVRQLSIFSIYWHFLGGLWIYLLLFFTFNH